MRLAIDKREFGEVYHIAACALFAPATTIALLHDTGENDVSDKKEFFESIIGQNSGRICVINRKEYERRYEKKEFNYLKETADLIDPEFEDNKNAAQKKIREKFILGLTAQDKNLVRKFLASHFRDKVHPKVLLWTRNECYEPQRNSTTGGLKQLHDSCLELKMCPIPIGSYIPCIEEIIESDELPNLIEYFNLEIFISKRYLRQLYMFELLKEEYKLIGEAGMMSGSMDGPALMGLPTIWFARDADSALISQKEKNEIQRMDKWTHIPNYKKITVSSSPRFLKFTNTELNEFKKLLKEFRRVK